MGAAHRPRAAGRPQSSAPAASTRRPWPRSAPPPCSPPCAAGSESAGRPWPCSAASSAAPRAAARQGCSRPRAGATCGPRSRRRCTVWCPTDRAAGAPRRRRRSQWRRPPSCCLRPAARRRRQSFGVQRMGGKTPTIQSWRKPAGRAADDLGTAEVEVVSRRTQCWARRSTAQRRLRCFMRRAEPSSARTRRAPRPHAAGRFPWSAVDVRAYGRRTAVPHLPTRH